MKKSITFLKSFLCVILVCIITVGITLLILESKLWYSHKTVLVVCCLGGGAVLCGLYEMFRENKLKDEYAKKSKQEKTELYKEIEELKNKIKNSVPINPSTITDDRTTLLHKCAVLEEFRSSFPHTVSDNYVIYNIMRTEIDVSRFSRWQIVGAFNDELWQTSVIRPDTQTYKEMLMLISGTKTPAEITGLNMPNDLLWQ